LLESLQTAVPLRSADVTPLPRYYRPSRIPLAIYRFAGAAGYTASLLRRFLDGRGGFLQFLGMSVSASEEGSHSGRFWLGPVIHQTPLARMQYEL